MGVKKETIIRTIVLALALINQILSYMGIDIIPVTDEELSELVTLIFTIAASIWAWWKNNSFTQPAIEADAYMELRRGIKKQNM